MIPRSPSHSQRGSSTRIASLTYDGGVLVMESPYHEEFLASFKSTIHYSKRQWHTDRKVWLVDKDQYETLLFIMEKHFDEVLLINFPKNEVGSNAYSTLFLLDNAPVELVRSAYKTLAMLYHPDRGGDQERMKAVNKAYEEITKLKNGG